MRQLKIAQRLMLVAIAFIAGTAVLAYMITSDRGGALEFAASEHRGVQWHKPARALIEDLMRHRTYASGYLAGDPEFRTLMDTSAREIEEDFAALEQIDQKLGAEMQTTPLVAALRRDWGMLKAATPSLSAEECFRRHNQLVYDAMRAVIRMGNYSKLILDPEIETYYLMDATHFKLAYEADHISQLQALGLIAIVRGTNGQPLAENTRAELSLVNSRARQNLRDGLDNLQYALEADPALAPSLSPLMSVTESSINGVLGIAEREILVAAGSAPSLSASRWMTETNAMFEADFKLFDSCLGHLDRLLAERISGFQWGRAKAIGLALLVIVGAVAGLGAIIGSIISPLRRLGEEAERISLGEIELQIETSGADEITDLARKFKRMQESMKIAAQLDGEQLL